MERRSQGVCWGKGREGINCLKITYSREKRDMKTNPSSKLTLKNGSSDSSEVSAAEIHPKGPAAVRIPSGGPTHGFGTVS